MIIANNRTEKETEKAVQYEMVLATITGGEVKWTYWAPKSQMEMKTGYRSDNGAEVTIEVPKAWIVKKAFESAKERYGRLI